VIAEEGMILRVQVGSGVHGTSITGQDDRDEMGLCLEPPQFVTGLARVPNGIRGQGPSVRFEQYERHTAWDKPGGLANRSGAGDLDVIIYSARKWARLALAGNPTVLLVLFIPDEEVVFRDEAGAELVRNADRFVSRLAAGRFLGYLQAQKAAPVPEPDRTYLRSIRRGERPLAEVLDAITGAEAPSPEREKAGPMSREGAVGGLLSENFRAHHRKHLPTCRPRWILCSHTFSSSHGG
jgi:hypothetical protein